MLLYVFGHATQSIYFLKQKYSSDGKQKTAEDFVSQGKNLDYPDIALG